MGRDKRNEQRSDHWTKMIRVTMQEPAWRALSSTAQALYPWLKLEWGGPSKNNNGRIRLSVRQAADRLGVSLNTAGKAFHDLQAKGFIVIVDPAYLGSSGRAKSPDLEITELPLPQSSRADGRKLYREWKPDRQFPVQRMRANNPLGANGKTKPHLKIEDGDVIEIKTFKQETSSK